MRNWTRLAKWPLVAVLAVGVSGCDLEVLNPGSIQDQDLTTPELMPILVAGVSAEYNDIQDLYTMNAGRLTDDMSGTGSYGSTQRFRQGIFDDNDSEGYWEQTHEAAWAAGEAWTRLQEVLGGDANSNVDAARLFILMGHAHNRLGENFCDVVYDVGSAQPRAAAFDSAIVAFNQAITIATAAGSSADQWRLSALGGIAQAELGRARLGTGSWAAASAAAATAVAATGEDWSDDAIYNAQANSNQHWIETHNRAEVGVWGTLAQTLHDNGDPRTPYTKCGEWVDTSRPDPDPGLGVTDLGCTSGSGAHQGADGLTAHYRQDKYPERGSDIPRVTGYEMRMIMAEAALQTGDLAEFTNQINLARAAYGDPVNLPPIAQPATAGTLDFPYEYPAVDAWSIMDQERYAWKWLTGSRLFDLDQWDHPFLAGGFLAGNVPGAGAINPRLSCMPVPRNECELNPNLAGSPVCG